jgi:hypothetical protein
MKWYVILNVCDLVEICGWRPADRGFARMKMF